MNYKSFVIFPAVLFFITLFVLSLFFLKKTSPLDSSFCQNSCSLYKLGGNKVRVKIADSETERQRGLSGTAKIAENEGMLFIFPYKQMPVFWMKEMNFPLDFIWIADNKVVDLAENIPNSPAGTPDHQIARCQPSMPVNMILEINSGWINKNGVEVGDIFLLEDK